MADSASTLMILERAHRGAAETQFADMLYSIRELNRRGGPVEVALRGLAVSHALDAGFDRVLSVGALTLDTLADPRASLRNLLADGVPVWVEEPDLRALGPTAADRLLPGVRRLPSHGLAARWPRYERVWFM